MVNGQKSVILTEVKIYYFGLWEDQGFVAPWITNEYWFSTIGLHAYLISFGAPLVKSGGPSAGRWRRGGVNGVIPPPHQSPK